MRITAVFSTMTQAQHGAGLLARAAIPAEVVKVDTARTRHGCAWGVAFREEQLKNVRTVFTNAGITEREYIPEEIRHGIS